MNRIVLRRGCTALLWALLLLTVAAMANVLGIYLAGSVESWQQWLADHHGHFLIWRLLLYAGTAWGWLWMRRRVLNREPSTATRQCLLRAEIAAGCAVAALEISQFV